MQPVHGILVVTREITDKNKKSCYKSDRIEPAEQHTMCHIINKELKIEPSMFESNFHPKPTLWPFGYTQNTHNDNKYILLVQ